MAHGKRDLPFEWINAETRQCCINRNELSQDGSEILTASTTFDTSGSSYICKRRKLLKNSVVIFPLEVEVNEVPVFAAKTGPSDIQVEDTIDDGTSASSLSADKSVLEFNGGNASVLNSQNFSKNPCSEVKVFIKPDVNTNSKSVSFGKEDLRSDGSLREPDIQFGSVIKTNEANHITESLSHDIQGSKVSNQELFLKELCISVLRSNGLLERACRKRSCASTDVLGIGSDIGYTQSCKQCSLSENILIMLVCDQCEEAFHVSCCKPKLRMLPIDEWFCHSCSKMNCNLSNKKSVSNSCITRSYTASRFGSGPIAHMLKHTESYASKVRIGKYFQAEVPDWRDQISNFLVKFPLPKSASNWLQCLEVLYDDSRECVKGTICGKWRRAPFAEVQTDVWECSCAVLWDPAHADCAVPQELETEQVLQHLKQIEKLKSRLASRKRTSVMPLETGGN
ncbi:hypothetical protein FH972_020676 [Carpinus fangiana]|uniref:PHD-type domain-containing protein n=1 Tax=Carpinus fangiana TaxID=176857 RepID=A0A5N6RU73_9ROSI|nr:hypothetical protein FH972_020676 [Carpinus fangiana]